MHLMFRESGHGSRSQYNAARADGERRERLNQQEHVPAFVSCIHAGDWRWMRGQ
jgi:hypothetical protein